MVKSKELLNQIEYWEERLLFWQCTEYAYTEVAIMFCLFMLIMLEDEE